MSDKSFQQMIEEAVEIAIQKYADKIQAASLNEERLYTISELASHSGFTTTTIYRWITRDHDPLPAYQIDREYRIVKKEFDQWLGRYRLNEKIKKMVVLNKNKGETK